MNVGSLFSGIGGMDYGLARAGLRHAFFCESDPWRRQVLATRWPGVPIYHDVRGVAVPDTGGRSLHRAGGLAEPHQGDDRRNGWSEASALADVGKFGRIPDSSDDHAQLRETARQQRPQRRTTESVDLLCGGFPCQDVSVAGQRQGLAGERSGLFYEFARIAGSLRPRWVLVENVPGLLSSNGGRDFGAVLGTLADIGYGLGWRILDSRFFGVPQRRRRVFIVGALADGDPAAAARRAGQVLAVGSRCPGHPPAGTEARQDVAVASLSGLGTGGPDDNDGQAGRVIPVAPALVKRYGKGTDSAATDAKVAVPLTRGSATGEGVNQPGRRQEDAASIGVSDSTGVRRLTPIECERLQGLPDGWTDLGGSPDSRRYSGLGDAVTATVAEWIGRRLVAA